MYSHNRCPFRSPTKPRQGQDLSSLNGICWLIVALWMLSSLVFLGELIVNVWRRRFERWGCFGSR